MSGGARCLPGEDVSDQLGALFGGEAFILGPGLTRAAGRDGRVMATLAGELKKRGTATAYVSNDCSLYHCKEGDQVLAVIEDRGAGDFYKVNISANKTVMMAKLAFDGATKRNKPELKKGDVVYCRVSEVHPHLDPQLSCMAPANGGIKKDWSSGEALYGELRGGVLVRVSSATTRGLLHPKSAVLTRLGSHMPFEVAVGANGLVWLRGSNVVDTVVLRNAITNCGGLSAANANDMVDAIVSKGKEKRRELGTA